MAGDTIYNLIKLNEYEVDEDDRPHDPPRILVRIEQLYTYTHTHTQALDTLITLTLKPTRTTHTHTHITHALHTPPPPVR